MTTKDLNQIAQALNEKKAVEPCPRCLGTKFSILGISFIDIFSKGEGLLSSVTGTRSQIPTILVACDNCGYLAHHAQAILESTPRQSALKGLSDG